MTTFALPYVSYFLYGITLESNLAKLGSNTGEHMVLIYLSGSCAKFLNSLSYCTVFCIFLKKYLNGMCNRAPIKKNYVEYRRGDN